MVGTGSLALSFAFNLVGLWLGLVLNFLAMLLSLLAASITLYLGISNSIPSFDGLAYYCIIREQN